MATEEDGTYYDGPDWQLARDVAVRDVHPKDSPIRRQEIHDALDAVIRAATDVVRNRSSDGRWVPHGDLIEFADNYGLARVARNDVIDRLETRIAEARRVLDQIEADRQLAETTTAEIMELPEAAF